MIISRERNCFPANGKSEHKPCSAGSSRTRKGRSLQEGDCSLLTSQATGIRGHHLYFLTSRTQTANSNSFLTLILSLCNPGHLHSMSCCFKCTSYLCCVVSTCKSQKHRKTCLWVLPLPPHTTTTWKDEEFKPLVSIVQVSSPATFGVIQSTQLWPGWKDP